MYYDYTYNIQILHTQSQFDNTKENLINSMYILELALRRSEPNRTTVLYLTLIKVNIYNLLSTHIIGFNSVYQCMEQQRGCTLETVV
jgi:hypothetical protein